MKESRSGFALLMVIFLIIIVGMMFVILANASKTIAAQTTAVYRDAVKSNLAASQSAKEALKGNVNIKP